MEGRASISIGRRARWPSWENTNCLKKKRTLRLAPVPQGAVRPSGSQPSLGGWSMAVENGNELLKNARTNHPKNDWLIGQTFTTNQSFRSEIDEWEVTSPISLTSILKRQTFLSSCHTKWQKTIRHARKLEPRYVTLEKTNRSTSNLQSLHLSFS